MATPLMSDTEQRRRQKLQGKIGRTTSTLGLAGVGLAGTGALLARKPGALKAIPKLGKANPEKLKNAAFHTGIISGGIGGVGGFNQASIYSAEARRRKAAAPVKKSRGTESDMDAGYYGEEGHPVKLPVIEVPIEKAWSPSASNFDSEGSRQKRAKVYQGGTLVAAGAGTAVAARHGAKAVTAARGVKPREMTDVLHRTKSTGQSYKIGLGSQGRKAIPLKALKGTVSHGGKAAAGVAAVGVAGGVHAALKRKQKEDWSPYAKRDTMSAFGVDHDNPNGQHRETEN